MPKPKSDKKNQQAISKIETSFCKKSPTSSQVTEVKIESSNFIPDETGLRDLELQEAESGNLKPPT